MNRQDPNRVGQKQWGANTVDPLYVAFVHRTHRFHLWPAVFTHFTGDSHTVLNATPTICRFVSLPKQIRWTWDGAVWPGEVVLHRLCIKAQTRVNQVRLYLLVEPPTLTGGQTTFITCYKLREYSYTRARWSDMTLRCWSGDVQLGDASQVNKSKRLKEVGPCEELLKCPALSNEHNHIFGVKLFYICNLEHSCCGNTSELQWRMLIIDKTSLFWAFNIIHTERTAAGRQCH